jgi:hypothetical protein
MPRFYLRGPKSAVQGGRGAHLSRPAVFRLPVVKSRAFAIGLAALAATLLTASLAAAAMIGIYRNPMESLGQRSQMIKLSGASCSRAGAAGELRITIGKRTRACSFRTPVLGRDLEIAASERLLSATPKPLQNSGYVGLELRAGGGAKYQMLVFPKQRKVQLVKVTKEGTKYLDIDKNEKAVVGVNQANALRLRAINVTSGPEKGQARILGYIGKALAVEAVDAAAGELSGRASSVIVGAAKAANGLLAGVDDVVVRVPSPY